MEVPIISDEINKSDISNRKKLKNRLTTGVFALLIALIAVVSATYAWYIYNTSRHTTKVRMAAGTGVNLQISNSYSGTYGSAAVLDSFAGQLVPVSTNRISGGFQKVLGFTNGTENQSNLVASLFGKGDYSDYYNTSLFLKTNGDPTDIYIADIGFEDSDPKNPISSAIRVGFVVHKVGKKQPSQGEYIFAISDKKNPQAEYNTAKGKEGDVLDCTKTDGKLKPVAVTYPYIYATTYTDQNSQNWIATKVRKNYEVSSGTQKIASSVGYDGVKMRVYIWMEGTDADCVNNAAAEDPATYNVNVKLAGISAE